MKRKLFLTFTAIALCLILSIPEARAQSKDVPRFEVAAEFTSITKPDFDGGKTEPGYGARFTYNIKNNFAVEAAGYFFPHECEFCTQENRGSISEGLFGVKVGKRFKKWGIFAKARPGLVSFSEAEFNIVPLGTGGPFPFDIRINRLTHFAFDAGGVIEFYPSKRIVTRFDAGDTIIHYGRHTFSTLVFDPTTGGAKLGTVTDPAFTRHNFQFIASVGFRF